MDNLNKTISFVLGLVVVLVFFAVISGRLNLKGKLPTFGKVATPTPTQTQTQAEKTNTTLVTQTTNNTKNTTVKKTLTIPQTGSPTMLLPILLSGLAAGLALRKSK